VAQVEGLTLKTQCNELLPHHQWFAYVTAGCAAGHVGSANRCATEQEAIEYAICDAETNLELLADKAREAGEGTQ
jgi:hypothetical protein